MSITFETIESLRVGEKAKESGRALVLFYEGGGLVLCWQATPEMANFFHECGAGIDQEGYTLLEQEFDFEPQSNGVYIAELRFVDGGAGDIPGTRETLPGLHKFRVATKAEYDAHRCGEYPWENSSKGWAPVTEI